MSKLGTLKKTPTIIPIIIALIIGASVGAYVFWISPTFTTIITVDASIDAVTFDPTKVGRNYQGYVWGDFVGFETSDFDAEHRIYVVFGPDRNTGDEIYVRAEVSGEFITEGGTANITAYVTYDNIILEPAVPVDTFEAEWLSVSESTGTHLLPVVLYTNSYEFPWADLYYLTIDVDFNGEGVLAGEYSASVRIFLGDSEC